MDKASLQTKIQISQLLSEAERAYWLQNLPRMTEQQLQKLDGILSEAMSLAWNKDMQHYIAIATKAQTAFAA